MRVLATNLMTTTFAAAALVSVIATGFTPSTAQAAPMQDRSCATVGSQCGQATGTSSQKKPQNLAARALSNKVLMDVMLGNAKSNPELTVGCGVSGICVTLIPEQPTDPDHVGVPGILTLTNDSGAGPQSFPSPRVDTAFIAGAASTGRFAGRSTRVAAGPVATRAFSSRPAASPGSNPPGQTPGSPAPGGPIGGPGNPGPNDPGNPDGKDPGDGVDDPGEGKGPNDQPNEPGPVFEPPFIDVDAPVEVIRVPEPSTLFIFGFALLAMAAFGARKTKLVTNENRVARGRR